MHSIPRALLITASIGILVALAAALGAGGASTRAAATHSMAARALDDLALLAGLASDEGELLRDEPMAVEVISDGGPMWALASVEAAAAKSRYFAVGDSPHLLRLELIEDRRALALQLHLWRGGWELREASPRRVRVAPWAPVLAAIVGAALALISRRPSLGIAGAGVLAQLLVALARPPPDSFPPQRLVDAWAEGPLFGRAIPMIREMGTVSLAGVVAVLAGTLVLVAFDHRRTRGKDEDVGLGPAALAAVFVTLGTLAWLEAASRASLFAACDLRFGAYFGWVALIGLILGWLPAIRVGREAWRARN